MTTPAERQRPRVPERAEIRRICDTNGFELLLDDEVFPYAISREPAEVTPMTDADDPHPWHELRIGIIIAGPVIGADEFNDSLADGYPS